MTKHIKSFPPPVRKIFIFIVLTAILVPFSAGQENNLSPYGDRVMDENIKTVLLFRENAAMTLPVISLNSGEKLELHFDDLSGEPRSFSYTLVHCNARWEPSPLHTQEYLDGYGSGTVEKAGTSFNTTRDYMHYRLVFPTPEANPRISGNYVLVVYDDRNPEKVVLTRQLFIAEPLVTLEAEIRRPADDRYYTGQEIEFRIQCPGYSIADPAGDITVLIRQNRNPYTDLWIEKPRYVGPDLLEYGGNNSIVFDGGNEFRFFDIKSMKYEAENISRIDFLNPYYHVFLRPDEPRTWDPYFTRRELNGDFYTDAENAQDRHTEADYVVVHFVMPAQVPYSDAAIYVFGALTDWSTCKVSLLSFDAERHCYELAMLLKQGFYNYQYVYLQNGSQNPDAGYFEGNHYETENEYTFLVFHTDPSWDYDRLIAVSQVHSGSR